MKTNGFGCLNLTGLLAAVLTLLFVTGVTLVRGGTLFSPGKLNAQLGSMPLNGVRSHAEISNCSSCHVAPWEIQTMSDRCIDCHQNIAVDSNDFHKVMLVEGEKSTCRECHTDHRGAEAALTIDDMLDFPHEKLGFSLHTHLRMADGSPFACSDCHGETYITYDIKTCQICHTKIDKIFMQDHLKVFGANCLSCHDGLDSFGKSFDHTMVPFALTGKHSEVACQECHLNAKTISDLQAAPLDCTTCHIQEDPHGGRFGVECGSCHTPAGWKPAKFDHNLANFKLIGKHIQVDCKECHRNEKYTGTPQDCTTCHAQNDVHQGQLGQDCASCHTPEGWKPARFDHSKAAFQLVGKHAGVECESCHTNKLFKGTPQDCTSCHLKDDAHNGQFGTDCSLCHSPQDWKSITFNHSTTAFPLIGLHGNVACLNCHTGGPIKATPKDCESCHLKEDAHNMRFGTDCGLCHTPLGWKTINFSHSTTVFPLVGKHANVACLNCHTSGSPKSTPIECFACHRKDDQHAGQFGADCKLCHTPAGWSQVIFDHSKAVFKLTGAHIQVNCQSCHSGGKFKGTPTTCYACHKVDDHHNGQFGTDCGTCHSTQSWKGATFDHSRTAFQLTGKHSGLACQSCHNSGTFKGTPKDCYACHAKDDNHGGQFGTDCGTCHTTQSWQGASFDHSRASFQLTGAHAQVACTQCHSGGKFTGTPSACAACHAEPNFHMGVLGTDCGACHDTSRWKPASYNGSHTFPMNHGNPASCSTCHPSSLGSWTCYSCHDQGEITTKHQEENIGDFSNCIRCHPTGRKEGGD
jgi:hypothetical protein